MAKILFKGHTAQHIREAEPRESFSTQTDQLNIKKEKREKTQNGVFTLAVCQGSRLLDNCFFVQIKSETEVKTQ